MLELFGTEPVQVFLDALALGHRGRVTTRPGRRLAAALPPVLMMLAFEIDVQIVRWVMTALGKPLGPIASPPVEGRLAGPVPGAVWRSDGTGWNLPLNGSPNGWPAAVYGSNPAGHHLPETHRTAKPASRLGRVATAPG